MTELASTLDKDDFEKAVRAINDWRIRNKVTLNWIGDEKAWHVDDDIGYRIFTKKEIKEWEQRNPVDRGFFTLSGFCEE